MKRVTFSMLAASLFCLSPAWGQDAAPTSQPVSRQEIDQIKQDNAEMKKELSDIKKQQTDQQSNADQDAEDSDKRMKDLTDQIAKFKPGLEQFVLAGDASVGFSTQKGSTSSFSADMSPLILWQPPDKNFLVETAFDLGIDGQDINSESTTVTLNLADISYTLCDNCIIGGGLFAVPFGQFHNHFDPPWINKFPDDPMAFDAIAPISEVGIYVKGAVPSGTTRWTYDLYVANGPNLITTDPGAAGQLNFNDYTDLNNNKAIGGRIGFLPFPDTEMGYSVQYSDPNPGNFQTVHVFMQAVDFHHKPIVKALGGQFDIAGEWIWSKGTDATYDPTGSLGFGPSRFNNFRQGGYASIGYRPTESDNKILRNCEVLLRFDSLQSALNSPGGEHESRETVGLDYWITPYAVVKAAYEFDHKKLGPNQDSFILQLGYGL